MHRYLAGREGPLYHEATAEERRRFRGDTLFVEPATERVKKIRVEDVIGKYCLAIPAKEPVKKSGIACIRTLGFSLAPLAGRGLGRGASFRLSEQPRRR